jgi:hypothetical protein
MSEYDHPEAEALERAAEWRLRLADADPADAAQRAAAGQLQKLAEELRALPTSKLLEEYRCLCHWLSASDGISDLAQATHDYNRRIGFGEWPETATDYLKVLNRLANQLVSGD